MTRYTRLTSEQVTALELAGDLDQAARDARISPAADRLRRRRDEALESAGLTPGDLSSHRALLTSADQAATLTWPEDAPADPAPTHATGGQVRAPVGWEPSLATMGALLRGAWRRPGLDGCQPVAAVRDATTGRWVVVLAPPPVRRAEIVHPLAAATRPTDTPRVAAHLATRGGTLRR